MKCYCYFIRLPGRAEEAVAEDDRESYNIDQRKLSAIDQFALAMPLLIVPAAHIDKPDNKKRKRDVNVQF